jgi:small neutral amino acid transporter SnatA (MarC family)
LSVPLATLLAWAVVAILPIVLLHIGDQYGEPNPVVQVVTALLVFWTFLWLLLKVAQLYDSIHS